MALISAIGGSSLFEPVAVPVGQGRNGKRSKKESSEEGQSQGGPEETIQAPSQTESSAQGDSVSDELCQKLDTVTIVKLMAAQVDPCKSPELSGISPLKLYKNLDKSKKQSRLMHSY